MSSKCQIKRQCTTMPFGGAFIQLPCMRCFASANNFILKAYLQDTAECSLGN